MRLEMSSTGPGTWGEAASHRVECLLKRFLGKARTTDTFENAVTTSVPGRSRLGRRDPGDGNRPFGTGEPVVGRPATYTGN